MLESKYPETHLSLYLLLSSQSFRKQKERQYHLQSYRSVTSEYFSVRKDCQILTALAYADL